MKSSICSFGDGALLLTLPAANPQTLPTRRLRAVAQQLGKLGTFKEIVPAYDSLLVEFDPETITESRVKEAIETALASATETQSDAPVIEIPVAYGGEFGPDLRAATQALSLAESEIIARHSAQIYDVAMLGFIPGFCFLSAVDKKLRLPRHSKPRAAVASGSIGIANWQTGIYGLQSPGGWQIIGRTPLTVFDPAASKPSRLSAGDRVQFVPISASEFKRYERDL